MEWINYHHLLYFWTVAKEGGVAEASKKLHLSQPTVSAQVKALERSLGEQLFRRSGRRLVLTEMGQVIFGYADDIFSIGREMLNVIRQRPTDRPLRLAVGVSDSVPKLAAREILRPAFRMGRDVHVICREGKADQLLPELATHHLDIVLTDNPATGSLKVRAFNHKLGESGVTIMAAPKLAEKLRARFPQSLHNAPALLPTDNTALRRCLDRWFDAQTIRPKIVAEFEDTALLKVFAQDGMGFFAVHSVVAKEVSLQYGVKPVGVAAGCAESFFAVSVERKLKHPAVVAITDAARTQVFIQS